MTWLKEQYLAAGYDEAECHIRIKAALRKLGALEPDPTKASLVIVQYSTKGITTKKLVAQLRKDGLPGNDAEIAAWIMEIPAQLRARVSYWVGGDGPLWDQLNWAMFQPEEARV
jgi:hypothetical protein